MTREHDIIKIADYYGLKHQSQIAIEELSELIKAICKFNRAENSTEVQYERMNIVEEIADVEIMLFQLKYMLDINPNVVIDAKVTRQLDRIKKEIKEKKNV